MYVCVDGFIDIIVKLFSHFTQYMYDLRYWHEVVSVRLTVGFVRYLPHSFLYLAGCWCLDVSVKGISVIDVLVEHKCKLCCISVEKPPLC